MELWFVNCTKQNQIINLRHSEQVKTTPHNIPMGKQKRILKDATKEEVDNILSQVRHYGFVDISKVDSTRNITSLCYSIKAISEEKIFGAIETNGARLDERVSRIHETSALASHAFTEKTLTERGAVVQNTEMEIQEILPGNKAKQGRKRSIKIEKAV